MGTRALIGMTTPERQVRFITCFMDGYPQGAGKLLAEHWRTRAAAQTLMELGEINSLGTSPDSTRTIGQTPHQQGNPVRPAETAGSIEEFLDEACSHRDSSWAYLFTDNGWGLAAPTQFVDRMTALEPLEHLLTAPA